MNLDGSTPGIDLSRGVLPLSSRGRSYELLDVGLKSLARFPLFYDLVEEVRRHPSRTVFVVKLWVASGGSFAVTRRWLVSLGLDGRVRISETQKHWTIRNAT